MTAWLFLLGAVGSEVTGSLALKAALDDPRLYVVVVVGYLASFGFLTGVLQKGMGLGTAYGIWGALGVAATAVLSAVLFDEAFTALMGGGIALIIAGVLLVELGSHREAEPA